ncbi:MAG: hypothetical protein AB4063_24095 [Crocosphaera sp.]
MNTKVFGYDECSSLNIILNQGQWFSLEDLSQIVDVQQTRFIKKTNKSHSGLIDNRPFCTFQECCRRLISSNQVGSPQAFFGVFQTVVPQLHSLVHNGNGNGRKSDEVR